MSANIPAAKFTTFEDEIITGLEAAERVRELIRAVMRCTPSDAEEAISGILEEMRIGPPACLGDDFKDDAAFWASIVTYEELISYFVATGRRLVRHQRARG